MTEKKPILLEHDHPMDETLCVFKTKDKDLYVLGYVKPNFINKTVQVVIYGKRGFVLPVDSFESYQPVLNKEGGFLFIKNLQP